VVSVNVYIGSSGIQPYFTDDQVKPEPQDWYFTFGGEHYLYAGHHGGQGINGAGIPLRNRYVVIHGTFLEARQRMYEYFGEIWCDQYARLEDFAEYYPETPQELAIDV
jgi:hypothetical protein